jgi:hypothetical protein
MSRYLFDSGIENLSGRINIVTDKNDSFRNYIDRPSKKDNLEHKITWIIARLLVAIDIPKQRTVQYLMDSLIIYNQKQNSSITFDTLIEKNWVRIIFDSIEFPSQVSRYFRLLEKEEGYQMSSEDTSILKFLYNFKKNSETNIRVVSYEKALEILSQSELQLLIEREILKKGNEQTLIITDHDYFNYRKNEIGAAIWLLLSRILEDGLDKIQRYVNIIIRFGIHWPDKLSHYFEFEESNTIQKLAYEALLNEDDLISKGQEFNKIWLDAPHYSHIDLNQETPPFEIIGDTPFQVFSNILSLKSKYYWLYEEVDTVRLKYGLLLNIVFQTTVISINVGTKAHLVFMLLNDIKRPYLIYHSCWIIQTYYQHLIPYLLTDINTSAISFILLNEIRIKENATYKDPNEGTYNNRKENELKTEFFKSQFDLFLDKISLSYNISQEIAKEMYNILIIHSSRFYSNTTYSNQLIHREERNRFEYFIKALTEKRLSGHFHGIIRPRVFPRLMSFQIDALLKNKENVLNHYIGFNCPKFELIHQILHLSRITFLDNELSKEEIEELNIKSVSLIEHWKNLVLDYFVIDFIDVFNPETKEDETRRIKRLSEPKNIEILNWGYFWAFLNEHGFLKDTLDQINAFLILDNTDLLHASDINLESKAKLKFLMKGLALGISEISRNKDKFEYSFQGIKFLLNELQSHLQKLTINHCLTDLKNQRLNVFDQTSSSFNNDLYHVSTIKLVFVALNKLERQSRLDFYKALLDNDLDLLFLLTIINLTESQELVDLITEQINQIDVESFITSVTNVDQWKNAIIEALNSSNHYEIAIPIISKIEAWLQKVPIAREQYSNLIFRTKLMLAFKQKSVSDIIQLIAPKKHYVSMSPDPLEAQRKYYLALHWGYNENNYVEASKIFQELISNNPSDTNSHYNIFHLGTVHHVEKGNSQELNRLKSEWEQFVQNAEELGVNDELKLIQPNINYTLLFHSCHFNDNDSIDRTVQNLDPIFKYDKQIIEYIFHSYSKRALPINANSYLTDVEGYYQGKDLQIIELVQTLREMIDNVDLINKLKTAYNQIQNMPFKELPKLVPAKLNGKQNIQEFIFQEIIQASCILIEKITSLHDIRLENKYNDLLLAILKLRLAVWNWSISDQPRAGDSDSTGNDLGQLDFLISSAGNSIALIEALILTYANKSYTQDHIKKCFDYLRHSKLHYVMVYFKGTIGNFDSSWTSYKTNVCEIEYEGNRKLINSDFNDTSDQTDKIGIHTGLTKHENGVNMYHIYLQIPSDEIFTTISNR